MFQNSFNVYNAVVLAMFLSLALDEVKSVNAGNRLDVRKPHWLIIALNTLCGSTTGLDLRRVVDPCRR